MKLKKLFAGVVAVAMMATMAMPSFAAKGSGLANSTVENKGQVEIRKTLVKEDQTMGDVPDSVTNDLSDAHGSYWCGCFYSWNCQN